jgi:hypothetical protein
VCAARPIPQHVVIAVGGQNVLTIRGDPASRCSVTTYTIPNVTGTVNAPAATVRQTNSSTTTTPSVTPASSTTTTDTQASSLFVSPGGSDANDCTEAAPCAAFQRAYSLSEPGGVVRVFAGTYPRQTLSVDNSGLSALSPVVFEPASGSVTVAGIDLTGANNVVFRGMTFGTGAVENRAWYQRYSSDTLCDRCSIHGDLQIDGGDADGPNGSKNVAFTNGDVGGYVANDADPQIGAMRGAQYLNAAQPENISFVNETFYNITQTNLAAHTECLQVLAVHGLTIKQSRFYGCNKGGNRSQNSIQFAGYDAHGTNDDYWNIILEDNQFNGGDARSNRIAFGWDNQYGFVYDCRNIVVKNNVISGTVLWGCPDASQVVSRNNIETFQWSGAWAMNQCNAQFYNDVWVSAASPSHKGSRSGAGCTSRRSTSTNRR